MERACSHLEAHCVRKRVPLSIRARLSDPSHKSFSKIIALDLFLQVA